MPNPWRSDFWWDDAGKFVDILTEDGHETEGYIQVDVIVDPVTGDERPMGRFVLNDGSYVYHGQWRER